MKYKVIERGIILSFLTPQDQIQLHMNIGDIIEVRGNSFYWLVSDNAIITELKKHNINIGDDNSVKDNTIVYPLLKNWLRDNKIKEIQ